MLAQNVFSNCATFKTIAQCSTVLQVMQEFDEVYNPEGLWLKIYLLEALLRDIGLQLEWICTTVITEYSSTCDSIATRFTDV